MPIEGRGEAIEGGEDTEGDPLPVGRTCTPGESAVNLDSTWILGLLREAINLKYVA